MKDPWTPWERLEIFRITNHFSYTEVLWSCMEFYGLWSPKSEWLRIKLDKVPQFNKGLYTIAVVKKKKQVPIQVPLQKPNILFSNPFLSRATIGAMIRTLLQSLVLQTIATDAATRQLLWSLMMASSIICKYNNKEMETFKFGKN